MFKIVIHPYERWTLVFAVGVYLCHFSFTQDCVRLEFPKYVFSACWNWLNIKEMISREREREDGNARFTCAARSPHSRWCRCDRSWCTDRTQSLSACRAWTATPLWTVRTSMHCGQWTLHSHPLWTVRKINRRRQLWQSSTADRTDNHSLCTVWTLVLCA